MAKDRGGELGAMKENYCVDNGAMIAYTGKNLIHNKRVIRISDIGSN